MLFIGSRQGQGRTVLSGADAETAVLKSNRRSTMLKLLVTGLG